jgi:quercetin dioxygenase-like cupin family protein
MMIERVYEITGGDERTVKKILEDEHIQLYRMVFHRNEGLPVHVTRVATYVTVIRGTLSIALGRQKPHEYVFGCMIRVPPKTKMKLENIYDDVLEILVVKYSGSEDGGEYAET